MNSMDPSAGDRTAPAPAHGTPPRMPRWVMWFVAGGVGMLVLIILVLIFAPEGHGPDRHLPSSGNHGADDQGSDADAAQACSAQPFSHGGGSGARVSCTDAEGPGQEAQSFDCGDPDHSGVELSWEVAVGKFSVSVIDGTGRTAFSEAYSGSGQDTGQFSSGVNGLWRVEATRGETFAGSFRIETFCAVA